MWQQILPGLRIKIFMTVLLGVIYPLVMTALSQLLFPHQANGSLITANGKVIGSELIGQRFTRPEYFVGRPSNAGANGYDPLASGGYNQGPTNRKMVERVKTSVEQFRRDNPGHQGPIPADLVTGSASGLDPHLSPASAYAQVARVSQVRGVEAGQVSALVAQFTETRDLGLLGEPRVNVLRLNLALDQRFPKR
jgi:K+-transporting ATPase ATPase C chain